VGEVPSDGRRFLRALVVDVFLLSLAGYLVLLVIATSYWAASTQPFSVVIGAATGGAFLAFVVVLPSYVAIASAFAVLPTRRPSHAASEEEVPAADQEVPSGPEPHAEQEIPADAPPRDEAQHVGQARGTERHRGRFPQDEGDEDAPPGGDDQDRGDHAPRTYPPRRVFLIGWIVIIAGSTAWEILSLVSPSVPTLSHYVRIVMTPAIGRAAFAVAWLVIGFGLFGPRLRREDGPDVRRYRERG
jgi:hypothetical protein